ncbi:MAG: L,D-transpeptidase family protein [Thiovulaceae bacterium]|nr:L,D-transpeptidase family protein [Sulfurimonadaceae bacterium]
MSVNLLYARQVVLVLSDDFNTTKAKMYCFEDGTIVFQNIDVNLGRNGLAWDMNDKIFSHVTNQPMKQEGDGKSPAGVFALTSSFGYEDHTFLLPFHKSIAEDICVDDSNSSLYNSLVTMPPIKPNSFEFMKRQDDQYKLGIVVNYNPHRAPYKGSCIFLHVQKELNHPTAGCTSMSYEDLYKLLKWLDISKKPILVQVTKEYLDYAIREFTDIPDSIKCNTKR